MSVSAVVEELPLIQTKMIFGITIDRVEEDEVNEITDDIFDQLEDDGFAQDEWDFLVWFRGETCYIIMYAPLMTRSSLLKVDGIDRLRPLSHTAKTLTDNRNTWFYPLMRRSDTLTASEKAAELLNAWQDEQYKSAGGERPAEEEATGETSRVHEVSDLPLPRRKKKETKVVSSDELLKIFNLEGAKDSNGKEFVFGDED